MAYELKDFIAGVEILRACGGLKGEYIGAHHEEIHIADPIGPVSNGNIQRLNELGWHYDMNRGWTFGTT
jgi:hypothetical protein